MMHVEINLEAVAGASDRLKKIQDCENEGQAQQ